MRKITKWFIAFVFSLSFCFSSLAAYPPDYNYAFELPELPVEVVQNGYDYFVIYSPSLNGKATYQLFYFDVPHFSGTADRLPLFSVNSYADINSGERDFVAYRYFVKGRDSWNSEVIFSSSGVNADQLVMSTVDIILSDGTIVLHGTGGSGDQEYQYDPDIPDPLNVRFEKKSSGGGQLKWDNAGLGNEYGVLVNGTYHYESNMLFGGSGDILYDCISIEPPESAGRGFYDMPESQWNDVHAKVKEALNWYEGINFMWYPTTFRVQFYFIEGGVIYYGNYAVCNVNWKSVKKQQWTSSSTIHIGGMVDGSIDPDGDGSSDHISGSGAIHGGGGIKLDSETSFDQDGNVVESGSADVTINGFLETLVNIPNVINRFFQSVSTMMSGMGQLPALLSQVVTWLPSDILTFIGIGILLVIVLRIFGR